jgi:hypothetical protein
MIYGMIVFKNCYVLNSSHGVLIGYPIAGSAGHDRLSVWQGSGGIVFLAVITYPTRSAP